MLYDIIRTRKLILNISELCLCQVPPCLVDDDESLLLLLAVHPGKVYARLSQSETVSCYKEPIL